MRRFDDFSEAFDYCRHQDKPVIVVIGEHQKWKLFPSGAVEKLTDEMQAKQATKDSLAKAKSLILDAIRSEPAPQLVDGMEFIAGKIEALQSRIKQ